MKIKTRPPQSRKADSPAPTVDPAIRIMILDDDALDIQAMRRCLASLPGPWAEPIGCSDIEDALVALEAEPIDLLFIDYHLGRMTGLEALEELRAGGCQAPAILLTGSHGEQMLHEAMRAGVMDYLPKERISNDLVGQTIRSVLAKAELHRRIQRKQESSNTRSNA
ncbi:Transcriptional regulatory protein DcuR [Planctomycetes bacterium Poly30]|uniref:Transcriptional regulatory protein DcuR n=1 Tax=Saltatorellus ferox TaxID=2528018 RepID=A0A518EQZ6_9BACT|nr:Transcriptional regulatory protein DcuR [Planctomycetes bacterium Poly30]